MLHVDAKLTVISTPSQPRLQPDSAATAWLVLWEDSILFLPQNYTVGA